MPRWPAVLGARPDRRPAADERGRCRQTHARLVAWSIQLQQQQRSEEITCPTRTPTPRHAAALTVRSRSRAALKSRLRRGRVRRRVCMHACRPSSHRTRLVAVTTRASLGLGYGPDRIAIPDASATAADGRRARHATAAHRPCLDAGRVQRGRGFNAGLVGWPVAIPPLERALCRRPSAAVAYLGFE